MKYKENVKKLIDDNTNQAQEIIHRKIEIWSDYVVFTGYWWFGFVLSILPWLIWIKYRKKDSTDRILYSGFFVIIVSLCLDVIGDQFGLWHYRFNVVPVLPTYFPWDVTLMPITIMFFLQIKPDFNPVIKAILFALFSSYIAEPFFHWMGIYVLTGWKYSYSVPIQFIIFLIAHYLSRRERFAPFISRQ